MGKAKYTLIRSLSSRLAVSLRCNLTLPACLPSYTLAVHVAPSVCCAFFPVVKSPQKSFTHKVRDTWRALCGRASLQQTLSAGLRGNQIPSEPRASYSTPAKVYSYVHKPFTTTPFGSEKNNNACIADEILKGKREGWICPFWLVVVGTGSCWGSSLKCKTPPVEHITLQGRH